MHAYLRDCLPYMKKVATHIMDYVDAATTNILSPDICLVKELKGMLRDIEVTIILNNASRDIIR